MTAPALSTAMLSPISGPAVTSTITRVRRMTSSGESAWMVVISEGDDIAPELSARCIVGDTALFAGDALFTRDTGAGDEPCPLQHPGARSVEPLGLDRDVQPGRERQRDGHGALAPGHQSVAARQLGHH